MTDKTPAADQPHTTPRRRKPMVLAAIAVGAVIGLAGVYGMGGLMRKEAGDPACRPAIDLSQKIAPLAHGEVAALTMASQPLRIPDLAFEDADGKPKKLSDWLGKTGVVEPL